MFNYGRHWLAYVMTYLPHTCFSKIGELTAQRQRRAPVSPINSTTVILLVAGHRRIAAACTRA